MELLWKDANICEAGYNKLLTLINSVSLQNNRVVSVVDIYFVFIGQSAVYCLSAWQERKLNHQSCFSLRQV